MLLKSWNKGVAMSSNLVEQGVLPAREVLPSTAQLPFVVILIVNPREEEWLKFREIKGFSN